MHGALRVSRRDDKKLDEELGSRSYGQNRSKQDVVAALPTRALTREFLKALNKNGINGGYELKHLGAWFNAVNNNGGELKCRLKAAAKGWSMLKGFWHSVAPWRVKRLVFITMVDGAALSATVAFVWTST